MKEKQAVKDAFSELAPRYETVLDDELKTFWGLSYDDYANQLLEKTELKKNQRVLDIATGTAVIPRKLTQLQVSGIQITGLDLTEEMLRQGKEIISNDGAFSAISLTCGDATVLPFSDDTFDVIVTGLASHHMNISKFLSEIQRTIKENGFLSMIDVGNKSSWKNPFVKILSRVIAFLYFIIFENITRAKAEAASITNLRTPDEWHDSLHSLGFSNIQIEQLPSIKQWLPHPYSIRAIYTPRRMND
jgi:demethylmenaquinone methyltransferase/2-methoxy-6-polyprenyl-1,4-benzoquinol methylase